MTVDDFECKKMPSFRCKIIILLLPMKNFIVILCTKFQRCMLLTYFVTVDLVTVTSPKLTAVSCHSAYVIEDGKVIKTERLNESKL